MSPSSYRNTYQRLLEVCAAFARRLSESEPDLSTAFQDLLRDSSQILQATASAIWLLDGYKDSLQIVAQHGLPQHYVDEGNRLSEYQRATASRVAPVYQAFDRGEPIWITGLLAHVDSPFHKVAQSLPFNTIYLAPMATEHHSQGVLTIYHPDVLDLEPEDILAWTNLIAQHCSIAYEQLALRMQLESQLVELDRANRYKDEFLGAISHELRTPISIFGGFLELLEDTATKDWTAEQHNFLRMMTGAVGQMTTLVDGLLDYASIRAGKLRLVRRVHDVVTFVRVLHESMLPYFKERKQELQLDLEFAPGEALEISFDEKRLRQVLMNLLTNASKYSKPGQPINLRARQITHALRIEVIDMGAGIPEGDLSKIFTTFYRVDNDSTRTTSGMGLGLPIAHELIKAHGGTLGVRSELGKGSVFFIDLPLESPAPTTEDLDLPDLVR